MAAHETFRERLHEWAEDQLRGYVERLARRSGPETAKEFNDPVWGTIVLHPLEVLVLDSPLLQRLRYVRQLGVIQLVYPGAHHTRLEHTLGVLHQVDRLIDSINEHYAGPSPVDHERRQLLRLTALCHDVGHGVMSHVSENALHNFEEIQQLRDDFSVDETIDADEITPLAEIASYFLLGSAAFADLLEQASRMAGVRLPSETVPKMQRAIIGQSIDNRVPLLHELISGPFDADKLDYMTRDALMSGVPVVTDIPRLVQKVRAVDLPQQDLPPKIGRGVEIEEPFYVLTGIDLSGGRTLDELMIGQVLLHDKLYRHQKVRAAEAMVASIFRQIADLASGGPPMAAYHLLDHELFDLTESHVERMAGRELTADESARVAVAIDLSQRLSRRELFVRAYAFAQDMPQDPYQADPDHYDSLEEIVDRAQQFDWRGELVNRIAAELQQIVQLLEPDLLERYASGLKPYLWLDPPPPPPEGPESFRAWLISEHAARKVHPYSEGITAVSRWSDAYLLTRNIGYLFTTPELSTYAFVATEVVFRRDHGVRTPDSMLTYAKQDAATLSECKRRLAEADYYAGLPFDVKPVPRRLQRGDVRSRVDAVLERLGPYEGPVPNQSDRSRLLSRQRILDWLRQFDEKFGEEPLNLLERLKLVGREEVVAALTQFVESAGPDFNGAAVCPLGTAKDSSAITTYYANDLRGFSGIEALSLPDALAQERPVIFLDDFVGSGQQAVSILEAWFDLDPSTSLDEARGASLSDAARQGLRNRKVGFVFAAGMPRGADKLRQLLTRLRLDGEVFLVEDPAAPRAFEEPLSHSQRALREECRRVGEQLLRDADPEHDQAWRDERALGYGNEAFLVTFPYNTPAQTLTCLWKAGKVDEEIDWVPLLPRRPKL